MTKEQFVEYSINEGCCCRRSAELCTHGSGGFDMSYYVLRSVFPYGFIIDEKHGVAFFNRDYEVISFGGRKTFRIEFPQVLLDSLESRLCSFLMGEDGSVLAGTFYYLYDDVTTITSLDKRCMQRYLKFLACVLARLTDITPNAYYNRTFSKKQKNTCKKRMREIEKSKIRG